MMSKGSGDRCAVASTVVVPAAFVVVGAALLESSRAVVVTAVRTVTAMAAPTPWPLRESPAARARFCRPIGLAARTLRSPVEVRVEPAPTEAVVTYFTTMTPADPAICGSPLPPAAAMPHTVTLLSRGTSVVSSRGVVASTVMSSPFRVTPVPTRAELAMSR